MEIFINSTYAQSFRGYRLMRMTDEGFDEIMSAAEIPKPVYNFFTEDLFKIIWCEISDEGKHGTPVPTGSYLGIKGFTGTFNNGKNGIVDIAFYADAFEIFMLARIAKAILGSFSSVSELIFHAVGIDTTGNYIADKNEFLNLFTEIPLGEYPEFIANTSFNYRSHRDLLHLAVCIGSRERAICALSMKGKMSKNVRGIITAQDFSEYISSLHHSSPHENL